MLPKKYRLIGQSNFKKIATQGRYVFLKEMGIKWLPNQLNNSCFAFIVSTQVDKRAVARNKIKRRLREIIYCRLKNIKSGFNVLILTRPTIKSLKFEELEERLEEMLKRANLLNLLTDCE